MNMRSNDRAVINKLRQIYEHGNPLALHQALHVCNKHAIPPPDWLTHAMKDLFINYTLDKKLGSKGYGNSVFGNYKKEIKKFVQAKAYHTVRAWQKNPHNYIYMPRKTINRWYKKKFIWNGLDWQSALRLASDGLKGTDFRAQPETIRKAKSHKFSDLTVFGDWEAEIALDLRDKKGIFGAPHRRIPRHIELFLGNHKKPK